MPLSLASQFLACRLCWNARPPCRNCCEKCTDQCNAGQSCYRNLSEKELVHLAHINNKPEGTGMSETEKNSTLDIDYLVSNPASHDNFKYVLERASEETIRGALQEIGDNNRKSAVITALNRQLKRLLEAKATAISATNNHHNGVLAMDVATYEAEREDGKQRSAEQTDRENRIAEAHEIIGRVQALSFIEKVTTISSLVQLSKVKESKAYRDLPNIGTWEKYCDYIGLTRQKVDEDLRNLATFGEQFLTTCQQFSLGYRDMRKLKQLTHDGSVTIEGDCLVIEAESIPIDQDHAEELQAAIERIITASHETKKRVDKLEKDFKGALKEETLSLQSQLKTQTLRVKELEVYEPSETDREWSVKQMQVIEDAAAALQIAIAKFIIDPRLKDDRHLQANVNAHLQEAELALGDVRTRLDDVIDMFRD